MWGVYSLLWDTLHMHFCMFVWLIFILFQNAVSQCTTNAMHEWVRSSALQKRKFTSSTHISAGQEEPPPPCKQTDVTHLHRRRPSRLCSPSYTPPLSSEHLWCGFHSNTRTHIQGQQTGTHCVKQNIQNIIILTKYRPARMNNMNIAKTL